MKSLFGLNKYVHGQNRLLVAKKGIYLMDNFSNRTCDIPGKKGELCYKMITYLICNFDDMWFQHESSCMSHHMSSPGFLLSFTLRINLFLLSCIRAPDCSQQQGILNTSLLSIFRDIRLISNELNTNRKNYPGSKRYSNKYFLPSPK